MLSLHGRLFFFTMIWLSFSSQANQLSNHPSAYLAMHGDDPVNWHLWDESVFQQAQKENKLIFLSSGYFSCHWCHVMQRESYQNPAIAQQINRHFIAVKIDRELNPALDAYLISFLENTQGYSGWPLNVFITPNGHPLVGLVYLPANDFSQLLSQLSSIWSQDHKVLSKDAANGAKELEALRKLPEPYTPRSNDLLNYQQAFIQQTWQQADDLQGGFGEQSKFPMAPQLSALLSFYQRNTDENLGEFLQLTLSQMATQGLRDQIGGGFYRYVIDPGWKIPHFEKMLYDNALMASLFFQAGDIFSRQDFLQVGLNTIDFMLREMQHQHGGFIASLSAIDDQKKEGGYYLWNEDELKRVLTPREYLVATRYWNLHGNKTMDDGHHATTSHDINSLAHELKLTQAQLLSTIQSAQNKLFTARSKRTLPIDDKRLASWNGLALSALTKAITITNKETYKQAAARTASYLQQSLWNGSRLLRAHAKQGDIGRAGLEDYALVAQGLFDYYQLTQDKTSLAVAKQLIHQAWQRFYQQGFQRSENMFLQYANREAMLADDVLPSSSATLITLSLQIGNNNDKRLAREALSYTHKVLQSEPFWYVGYLEAVSLITQQ
ncbi:MAG: thioredoxin domain-containing protein [Gammaproteobacteria bacterium]|nr:thioredoxin domain-containing protein [Gammaproteobacteria bacterium]